MKIYKSNSSHTGPTWSLMDDEYNTLAVCPRVDPDTGLDVSLDEAERILTDELAGPDEERDADEYERHWDGVVQVHVAGQESLGIGQPTHDPKLVAQQRAAAPTGCPECGVAYSFYFGVQLHSTDCENGGAK